jgi:thiol-disulfide isomerase/thioredoxin
MIQPKSKAKGIFFLPFLFSTLLVLLPFCIESAAQTRKIKKVTKISKTKKLIVTVSLPTVTKIDLAKLETLLKPNGKPILLNFWATWCEPCVEEFPDLVKIDELYRGKIDFYTISMDELSEINSDVPKFLGKMNAKMPAYLLSTPDESEAVSRVSKNWQGGLPFTVLFDSNGIEVYSRSGIIKIPILKAKLEKVLGK